MRALRIIGASVLLSVSASAPAEDGEASSPCYDVRISARAVEQIPSLIPESDDPNVIAMSWPWFLELEIVRVLDGQLTEPRVTVLSVQHTYFVSEKRTWLLRRNTLGGFNLVGRGSDEKVRRCSSGMPPAEPYLAQGPGKTLEQLRKEGEERYGRHQALLSR
jgi:hypothetical protein